MADVKTVQLDPEDPNRRYVLFSRSIVEFPEKVKEFKKGKKGLMGLFVGEVMKLSKGKADPKMTNDILSEKLKS